MKIVLGTNVLIAAFATEGLCHSLFEYCVDQHQLFISQFILDELSNGVRKKLKAPPAIANEILEYLRDVATLVDPKPLTKAVCRDAKDDLILALAENLHADYLITGDEDLLVVQRHMTTTIVTPRRFWEISRK